MVKKLKLVGLSFILFFRQNGIRPLSNNIMMLITNINIFFNRKREYYLSRKHYLNIELLESLIKLPVNDEKVEDVQKYNVWVLWWQGEDNMPPIVKYTYNSIKAMNTVDVILITSENYSKYVKLEPWIKEKVNKGIMKLPALSDYIRASLLYEYGGLWIDSTVLCTKNIPNIIYNSKFFTVHAESVSNEYVAGGRWNVQILGTNKRKLYLFRCIKYIFSEYWKKYNHLFDYLLVDYSIDYVYNMDSETKNMIDAIPMSNPDMHKLREMLNDEFNIKEYNMLVERNNFFKLTYKMQFDENNNDSYYHYIAEKWKCL